MKKKNHLLNINTYLILILQFGWFHIQNAFTINWTTFKGQNDGTLPHHSLITLMFVHVSIIKHDTVKLIFFFFERCYINITWMIIKIIAKIKTKEKKKVNYFWSRKSKCTVYSPKFERIIWMKKGLFLN